MKRSALRPLTLVIPPVNDTIPDVTHVHTKERAPMLSNIAAIMRKDAIAIYGEPPTEWKLKSGFTTDNLSKKIDCSVSFNRMNENVFRKTYKYDCVNKDSVDAKLYAEIFFQKKARDLFMTPGKGCDDTFIDSDMTIYAPHHTQPPNVIIPQIYNYGVLHVTNPSDQCFFYIDMEHIDFPTLQHLKRYPPYDFVCNAIDNVIGDTDSFLRCNGITHNDLKPDNILVNMSQKPMQIYIIDFGEATESNKGRTGTGSSTPLSVCGGKLRVSKFNRRKRTKTSKPRSYRRSRKSSKRRKPRSKSSHSKCSASMPFMLI